jgi:hypothetical protein
MDDNKEMTMRRYVVRDCMAQDISQHRTLLGAIRSARREAIGNHLDPDGEAGGEGWPVIVDLLDEDRRLDYGRFELASAERGDTE